MLLKRIEQLDIEFVLSNRRNENELLHNARLMELDEKVPEIAELQREIHNIGFNEMRSRLSGKKDETASAKIAELSARKDQLLKEAGYPADYLDPIYTCPKCHDYGKVDGQHCECVKKMIIQDLYNKSNLSNIFEKENFETFDELLYSDAPFSGYPATPRQNIRSIRDKAEKYVQNFDNEHGNVLIYGKPGVGKTFVANCIAKALLDSGHTVLYLSANEFFNDVIAEYIINKERDGAVRDIYNYIYESDLLIIDDLGTEGKNSFFASQFFEVINKRMLANKAVIITTNYTMDEIENYYSARVTSRLMDQYDFYPLYGYDIRDARRHKKA